MDTCSHTQQKVSVRGSTVMRVQWQVSPQLVFKLEHSHITGSLQFYLNETPIAKRSRRWIDFGFLGHCALIDGRVIDLFGVPTWRGFHYVLFCNQVHIPNLTPAWSTWTPNKQKSTAASVVIYNAPCSFDFVHRNRRGVLLYHAYCMVPYTSILDAQN